jgi:tetratricopeptide (TPR) repeat protein
MRVKCTAILTIVLLQLLSAQTDPSGIDQRILRAKAVIQKAINSANQELFTEAKTVLEAARHDDRYAVLGNYYVGYADYRLALILQQVDKDKAVAYLDSAVSRLEESISGDGGFAEAYALLSGCYGQKISLSPIKSIILGPKSGSMISKAKELAPTNPRVVLMGAISTYYTPALFGGSKEKGLEEMKSAAELYDRWTSADSLQPDWGKDEVWAWIGIARMERKETIQAKRAFDKSLEINPENGWVKHVLLPKLATQAESK